MFLPFILYICYSPSQILYPLLFKHKKLKNIVGISLHKKKCFMTEQRPVKEILWYNCFGE